MLIEYLSIAKKKRKNMASSHDKKNANSMYTPTKRRVAALCKDLIRRKAKGDAGMYNTCYKPQQANINKTLSCFSVFIGRMTTGCESLLLSHSVISLLFFFISQRVRRREEKKRLSRPY